MLNVFQWSNGLQIRAKIQWSEIFPLDGENMNLLSSSNNMNLLLKTNVRTGKV